MTWIESHRFDPRAAALADRHYSRQKIGSPQFVPPATCIVLLSECLRALWVVTWPRYVRHAWPGAWNNVLFRNEGVGQSSDLILEAIRITLGYWEASEYGIITFVDPRYVPGIPVRGERIYGYCYLKAGFSHIGFTKVNRQWVWHKGLK